MPLPFYRSINWSSENLINTFVVVQSLSHIWLCNTMDYSTPGFPVLHYLCELTQTHAHWVGDATQPSLPLSSPSPFAFTLSQHQVFSSGLALHIRWPKDWSFGFSISPSYDYSGLISFRIDWFDLLSDQGTVKSLQHHSSKASVLRCSAFFVVLFSHPYVTTAKTSSFYSHIWDIKFVFTHCLLYLNSWFALHVTM